MSDVVALSPLSHRVPVTAGQNFSIAFAEIVGRAMIDLRIQPADQSARDAVHQVLGFGLPDTPRSSSRMGENATLWLSIDQFLIITPLDEREKLINALSTELSDRAVSITDVSDARAVVRLSGAGAGDIIKKGTQADIDTSNPSVGAVSRLPLADIPAVIHRVQSGAEIIDLYVDRSYAESAWAWLERAARKNTEPCLFTRQPTPPV